MRYKLLTLLLAVLALAFLIGNDIAERRRNERIFGPDPANVKFECEDGTNGSMLVRDFKNAEAEIKAQIESTRKSVAETPGFKVEGEWPPVKVTKIEKMLSP